jgi:hypothetical protein
MSDTSSWPAQLQFETFEGLLAVQLWRLQGKQRKTNQIDQGEIFVMHNDYRPVMEHTIGKAAELSLFASCCLLDVSAYKA